MAQLMPLPLNRPISCFSKIQIGFTFLVPAHPDSPRKKVVKGVCGCDITQILLKIESPPLSEDEKDEDDIILL